MVWDRGYYYRVRKVKGRVVRQYVGGGEAAELAARMDARKRQQRQLDALERRQEKEGLKALDAALKAMSERIDLVARAALLGAGFYQHNRGEWRRRREQDDGSDASQLEER